MNKLLQRYFSISLIIRIAIGLCLGITLGSLFPQLTMLSVLGSMFVGALKGIAPILVLFLIISSLANSSVGIGKRFRTVILLYLISTFIASIIAVAASYIFPISVVLKGDFSQTAPGTLSEVFKNLLNNLVMNPVASIIDANYVGILFWAILIGFAFKIVASDSVKQGVKSVSDGISKVVSWIIQFAPFGILGITYETASTSGLSAFKSYGKLVVVLVVCMFIQAFVVNPIIVAIKLRKNPFPLVFTCLKESAITAFFTRSSAANIPVNMALCEKLGLDKDFYSVSIPLGATINMDGAAITISVLALSAANSTGVHVNIIIALLLCIVSTLGACGASGVTGGSILLIPMACSLLGVSQDVAMQMVSIGFIIGIIQDSFETALNSSSDVLLTATADYVERMKKSGV